MAKKENSKTMTLAEQLEEAKKAKNEAAKQVRALRRKVAQEKREKEDAEALEFGKRVLSFMREKPGLKEADNSQIMNEITAGVDTLYALDAIWQGHPLYKGKSSGQIVEMAADMLHYKVAYGSEGVTVFEWLVRAAAEEKKRAQA